MGSRRGTSHRPKRQLRDTTHRCQQRHYSVQLIRRAMHCADTRGAHKELTTSSHPRRGTRPLVALVREAECEQPGSPRWDACLCACGLGGEHVGEGRCEVVGRSKAAAPRDGPWSCRASPRLWGKCVLGYCTAGARRSCVSTGNQATWGCGHAPLAAPPKAQLHARARCGGQSEALAPRMRRGTRYLLLCTSSIAKPFSRARKERLHCVYDRPLHWRRRNANWHSGSCGIARNVAGAGDAAALASLSLRVGCLCGRRVLWTSFEVNSRATLECQPWWWGCGTESSERASGSCAPRYTHAACEQRLHGRTVHVHKLPPS